MIQWEYLVEQIGSNFEAQEKDLETIGKTGWELVTIDFDRDRAYFKRPMSISPKRYVYVGKPCDCLQGEDVQDCCCESGE